MKYTMQLQLVIEVETGNILAYVGNCGISN